MYKDEMLLKFLINLQLQSAEWSFWNMKWLIQLGILELT